MASLDSLPGRTAGESEHPRRPIFRCEEHQPTVSLWEKILEGLDSDEWMLVSKFLLENCDSRVSTGKIWVDFLCFISCVFWWNFGFFCFWLFDQRSTNPAEKTISSNWSPRRICILTPLPNFCPKKWDFSPFSVLLSKLSCPACLSKLNDSNLLTSQRDSSTSQSTSAAFSASSTSSRYWIQIRKRFPGNLPKKEAFKKKTSRYIVTLFSPECLSGSISCFSCFKVKGRFPPSSEAAGSFWIETLAG